MGRTAANEIDFNYQAVDRKVREGKGKPQKEWRIDGVDGLVLVTYPTGAAAYYFFYRDKVAGKTRKYRIGDHVSEAEAKRHKPSEKDAKQDTDAPKPLTLSEARRRAEELRHAVQDGSDPVAVERAKANAMTFKELAEQFLETPRLATKSRRGYRYALEKYAYPAIGHLPAADVTPDHVLGICKTIEDRRIVTWVDGQKVERSPRVQSQRTKSAIGGVYRWAKAEGVGNVKTNPSRDVAPRIGITRRTRTPTDDVLATFWAETENKISRLTEPMRLILQLAILTSQRRDEVAGACKSELHGLDTDNPVWKIRGDETYRGVYIEGRTKNGLEQTVYLSKQAAELFRKAAKLSADKEYVFPADMKRVKKGKEPRTPHINGESVSKAVARVRRWPVTKAEAGLKAAERALRAVERTGDEATIKNARAVVDATKMALKEAKPLIADFTIHDTRRAMSTWLKNQGVSRDVRDLALNHMGQSVDEQHYSAEARMERQVQAAFQSWSDHVSMIIGRAAEASNVVQLRA